VGHPQFLLAPCHGQPAGSLTGSHRWHPSCLHCLLKGCERWFLPQRPQARYCSPACQHAARRWRRWHAGQRYRASTHGKQRRRDQAQRYRSRRQQRSAGPESAPPPMQGHPEPPVPEPAPPPTTDPPPMPAPVGEGHMQSHPEPPVVEPAPPPTTDPPPMPAPVGEGQRPSGIRENSGGVPCDRPGCYVLFLSAPRSPRKHFCCSSCRKALRRVRQREARLRRRRLHGSRPRRRLRRRAPTIVPFMSSHAEDPPF
jgi:hypothetical protein